MSTICDLSPEQKRDHWAVYQAVSDKRNWEGFRSWPAEGLFWKSNGREWCDYNLARVWHWFKLTSKPGMAV